MTFFGKGKKPKLHFDGNMVYLLDKASEDPFFKAQTQHPVLVFISIWPVRSQDSAGLELLWCDSLAESVFCSGYKANPCFLSCLVQFVLSSVQSQNISTCVSPQPINSGER